jgi:Tol biopolymer transport system component
MANMHHRCGCRRFARRQRWRGQRSSTRWSHDSRHLLFFSARTGKNCIFIVTEVGAEVRRLTATEPKDTTAFFPPDDKPEAGGRSES